MIIYVPVVLLVVWFVLDHSVLSYFRLSLFLVVVVCFCAYVSMSVSSSALYSLSFHSYSSWSYVSAVCVRLYYDDCSYVVVVCVVSVLFMIMNCLYVPLYLSVLLIMCMCFVCVLFVC